MQIDETIPSDPPPQDSVLSQSTVSPSAVEVTKQQEGNVSHKNVLVERLIPFSIALGGILIGMVLFFVLQNTVFKKPISITPTPTPTLIPTATPVRQYSSLSKTKEFKDFEQAITTLSSQIQAFSVTEPMLQPPVLVLPLGFSVQ